MTKTLNISLIPALILSAFILLSIFAALPLDAAEAKIKESCTLSRAITIDTKTYAKGAVVGPLDSSDAAITEKTKDWGAICLVNTINAVTDWIFFILISIAFIFILIAGFMWMTGRGEPEKQKQAGQMIAAALVGIVIAILARIIPAVIIGVLA